MVLLMECLYIPTAQPAGVPEILKKSLHSCSVKGEEEVFLIGKNFYYGETVKKDVDQALLWLTKSARAGHTQAADLLQKILVEQDIRVHKGQYLWKQNDKKKSGINE